MADVKFIVECDATGALKSIKELDGAINAAAGTTAKAGGSSGPFGSLFAQFTAGTLVAQGLQKGIAGIKGFVDDAIKGAIDEEKAEKNLQAALEITGRTVEGNLKHYLDFAEGQMKVTTYTHEEVQACQTLLLQLTNLNQNGVDRATKGAMGLASTMGIDLRSATMMVTKAMEGNYTALGRIGIKVAENLTTDQKQASLLDQLEKLYGRSTAEVNTFGGAVKQMGNMWNEAKEAVGGAIVKNEAVRDLIKDITDKIIKLTESAKFKEWIDGASAALTEFLPKFVNTIAKVIEYAGKAAQGIQDASDIMQGTLFFNSAEIPFKEKSKAAQKEAENFVASLKTLHPQMREVQAAMEAGRDNWAAYVKWMRDADERATALAKQNKNLKPTIDEVGTGTKTLTADELKAIEAKKKLAEAAQAVINKYYPLRAAIAEIIKEKQTLTKAKQAGVIGWQEYEAGIASCNEALRNIGDTIKTDTIQNLTALEKMMRTAMSEIDKSADFTADNMASDLDKIVGGWKKAGPKVTTTTKTFMQEVSTIVADSVRNISSSIIGAFNIQGLLGAKPKTLKFDNSYYDQMVKAAEAAYEKTKSLAEASNNAAIKSAEKVFNKQELLISRAEQDEDRRISRHEAAEDKRYEAQYEREKAAIENSKMTAGQKHAALDALENKYEKAKEARENARENAKVARERAREDARLAREEAQEKKLEAIRNAGLKKLLDLQNEHQAQLEAIRLKEDQARQRQADDEERRQKSLWFKVKGIFATAIEEMATIWLTKFISKLISGSLDAGTSIAKNVAGPVSSIADSAGKAASGFLGALGSVGSIITAITSVISLLKGPQKQTDVTYWLKLQWELLQNSYNFYIGPLTWKLDIIANAIDKSMKPTLWTISTATQLSRDYLKDINEILTKDIKGKGETFRSMDTTLKSIDKTLGNLKGAQAGAVSTQTQLMVIHGTPSEPEYVVRGSQMNTIMRAASSGPPQTITEHHHHHIYLDGREMKTFITKTIRDLSRSELMQIHPRAVRTY